MENMLLILALAGISIVAGTVGFVVGVSVQEAQPNPICATQTQHRCMWVDGQAEWRP